MVAFNSLSAPNLLNKIRTVLSKLPDDSKTRRSKITKADCIMSALAIFGLKYSSLLQFEDSKAEGNVHRNLHNLYGINHVPSDTYLREELDNLSPEELNPLFNVVFTQLQRAKKLEPFAFIDNHYLLSVDGTGFFSSKQVHCNNCCAKNQRNGERIYYHMMHCASIVHPDIKEVIPLAPEAILKQDGNNKNDCEQNATKRLLTRFRREHPHLNIIVLEDSLHANGPHIKLLNSLKMKFILSGRQYAKDFNYFDKENIHEYGFSDQNGYQHQFRWVNSVSLNSANPKILVNILDYDEVSPKGKTIKFTWVTDLELNEKTVYKIMRGGRSRWRIENETFNTLKNQGYQFEHNFGHGYKNLSTVFSYCMMLAFLVDQAQQIGCKVFQNALIANKRKLYFWNRIRNYFFTCILGSWEMFYKVVTEKSYWDPEQPNTS